MDVQDEVFAIQVNALLDKVPEGEFVAAFEVIEDRALMNGPVYRLLGGKDGHYARELDGRVLILRARKEARA